MNSVFYKKIKGINKLLEEIDTREENSFRKYKKLFNQLSSLDIHFEKKYAIQTNLYINTKKATINNSIKKKLYQALTICNIFTNSKPRKELSKFKEEFINRYGEEEVPLIEVLDGELSIGYGASGSSAANILSRFGSGDDEIRTFVQKIVNDEKKMNSNQIIAEIIHLP